VKVSSKRRSFEPGRTVGPRHHRGSGRGRPRERRRRRDRCVYPAHDLSASRQRVRERVPGRTSQTCSTPDPSDAYYAHDAGIAAPRNCPEDMDFGNGHSHCMAMLLGTAGESIPCATASSASATGSAWSSTSTLTTAGVDAR